MKRFSSVFLPTCMMVILSIMGLALAGCCCPLPGLLAGESGVASPSAAPATPALGRPTATRVQSQPEDTPTLRPASPSPQPASVSTPAVDLQDLALYQPALRPEFAADVEAAPGATRYFIQVSLDPDQPASLSGVERVRYTNTESLALEDLYFRLYPNLPHYGGWMTVEGVMLNDAPVETALEAEGSALRVPLEPPLEPGAVADLTLWFQETLPTHAEAGYGLYAYADQVYALAGFYPTIPVYDDEGWNVEVAPAYGDATFTDVAFYQVRLTVPAKLTVVSSGTTLDVVEEADGTRTWVAVGGPMRDFYVAMSAGYQVVSQEVDGTRINSYYRSGQAPGGELALSYAVDALRLFEAQLGDYPYAELDVVATPTTAGGIEYPGAIVVAQTLYDEEGGYLELVIAHEVAHQWWYGLVGNDQLDEPWLDEALTNYSAYLYYEETSGRARADFIKERVFEAAYQAAQQEGRDRGVGGPVAGFSEPAYTEIVYGKGPLFFGALRTQLGEDAFLSGLQAYLEAHRYGVAYPEDLVAAFEEASGQQIDDLYRFWILGQPE
ncbi:MAG: hypothetical protein JSV81_12470 [Anaerolineales bacterium]|nr:MAG: hypothetical protein JSV81_12470 [Anaerolineales bacterium]